MQDIPMYKDFTVIEPVLQGHSSDKKYYIETLSGIKLLLRVSDISEYDKRKKKFELLQNIATLDINMTKPIDFGVCNNSKSVYMLLTWIEGESLHTKLSSLAIDEQYRLGVIAGEILMKIHSLPVRDNNECSVERFTKKFNYRMRAIQESGIKSKHEKTILDFLDANKQICFGRSQSIRHGDFHTINLLLTKENRIGVIDFGSADYGDPYEEFGRLVWNALTAPAFARGQIDGYFNSNIPDDFFSVPLIICLVVSCLVCIGQIYMPKTKCRCILTILM